MRIKDPMSEGEEPFNLVPLTDMVFNLLIFFMCATTFAQVEKEIGVQLPHASSFSPISAQPKQLIINIKENGSTVVSGKTVDQQQLAKLASDLVARDPQAAIIIRADERSVIRYFAQVARICKQQGVSEARIVYYIDDGK